MFKQSKRIIVAALLTMVLAASLFVGCGSSDDSAAVEAFVESQRADLEEAFGAMAGGISTVEISVGSGNEMIIATTYTMELGEEELAAMEEALDATTASLAPMMVMAANEAAEELDVDSFTITVKYLTVDGDMITSASFDAE